MELTKEHLDVLESAVVVNSWYVSADNLAAVGELVRAGYLTACDDYEGPQVIPTDKARDALLARGLVYRNEQENAFHRV